MYRQSLAASTLPKYLIVLSLFGTITKNVIVHSRRGILSRDPGFETWISEESSAFS